MKVSLFFITIFLFSNAVAGDGINYKKLNRDADFYSSKNSPNPLYGMQLRQIQNELDSQKKAKHYQEQGQQAEYYQHNYVKAMYFYEKAYNTVLPRHLAILYDIPIKSLAQKIKNEKMVAAK